MRAASPEAAKPLILEVISKDISSSDSGFVEAAKPLIFCLRCIRRMSRTNYCIKFVC